MILKAALTALQQRPIIVKSPRTLKLNYIELELELHLPGLGVSVCRGQNVAIENIVPIL